MKPIGIGIPITDKTLPDVTTPIVKRSRKDASGDNQDITMTLMKERKCDNKEANLPEAIKHYKHSEKPYIHATAEKFAISFSTLQNHLSGTETQVQGHVKLQVLTEYQERAIVWWCELLDE